MCRRILAFVACLYALRGQLQGNAKPQQVKATLASQPVPATLAIRDGRCVVVFAEEVTVAAGTRLQASLP